MQPLPEAPKRRLVELDGLRGLAAISVVLFHYTTRYDELYGHRSSPLLSFPHGHLGVELFFIISGFVILMTVSRTRSVFDFAVARFSRLYPAYWVAVIATFVVSTTTELWPGKPPGVDAAFVNLTMLQEFVGVPNVDDVYWTLSVELGFYAIIAALFMSRLLGRLELVSIGLLALSLVRGVLYQQNEASGLDDPLGHALLVLRLFGRIEFFITGMMLYLCWQDRVTRQRIVIIAATVLVTLVKRGPDLALVHAAFAGITALAAFGLLSFLTLRPFAFLGFVSYTLYLLHQYIGYAVIRGLEVRGIDATLAIVLTTGLMLACAWGLSTFIERPAIRLIRGWYQNRKSRTRRASLSAYPSR